MKKYFNRRTLMTTPPVSLLTGWLSTTSVEARSSAAHCRSPNTTIIGTWNAQTTFKSGPLAGQTERVTFHFLPGVESTSGLMRISIPGNEPVGNGRWWAEGNQILYCFLHPTQLPNGSQLLVCVTHMLTHLSRTTFHSSGEGNGYDYPNGLTELPIIVTSLTTTHATRVTRLTTFS